MKFIPRIPFVAIVFTTLMFSTSAQQLTIPADKKVPSPLETYGDPYLPNAFGNKKVAPPYHFNNNATLRTTGSTISSYQVNVDSSGLNIIGDAANEPNIAIISNIS